MDELLIIHETAIDNILIKNTGTEELIIFKFFGPDVNSNVPMLPKYEK